MKSLRIYKGIVMSTGLIPTIAGMILCIFFPDTYVLYTCSMASILYILYRLYKRPEYQPNIVLVHGTLALIICSTMKGIGGDLFIPDRTVPLTLEILILSFSLLYLIIPAIYNKVFSLFHYKISILNCWATQIITLFTGFHLFITCAIYLFFSPLSHSAMYIMTHILPPAVYIICIIVNQAFVRYIVMGYKKMPFLRIAPICNGKIYVLPRDINSEEPGKLDIPMENYIYANQTDPNLFAKEVEKMYKDNLELYIEPRFSLKHIAKSKGRDKTILLYILPLEEENQIHFKGGKFVTPEEIALEGDKYSSFLMSELEHLEVAAKIWQEFQ